MSRREDSAFDEAQYSAFLQEAVNKVKTEEDPLVLNQMKKLFKKNVPFTLRGYVAAYVAKQAMGDFKGGNYFHSRSFNSARGTAKPGRKERFSPRTSEEETFTRSPPDNPSTFSFALSPRNNSLANINLVKFSSYIPVSITFSKIVFSSSNISIV